MEARRPLRLCAVLLGALALAAPSNAQIAESWHHVPDAKSDLDFNRELAKCKVIAAQTPIQSTTRAIVEAITINVITNCLKAGGYEPGASPPPTKKRTKTEGSTIKMAGFGPGTSACSEFIAAQTKDEQIVFFSWGAGFLTGYNVGRPAADMLELASISFPDQIRMVREYCVSHPEKRFVDGMVVVIQALRNRNQEPSAKKP